MATAYETSPRDRARLMEQVAKVSGGVRHDKAKGVDEATAFAIATAVRGLREE